VVKSPEAALETEQRQGYEKKPGDAKWMFSAAEECDTKKIHKKVIVDHRHLIRFLYRTVAKKNILKRPIFKQLLWCKCDYLGSDGLDRGHGSAGSRGKVLSPWLAWVCSRLLHRVVDYIPQAETKNLASGWHLTPAWTVLNTDLTLLDGLIHRTVVPSILFLTHENGLSRE